MTRSISIEEALHRQACERAAEDGRSFSNYVVRLIRADLAAGKSPAELGAECGARGGREEDNPFEELSEPYVQWLDGFREAAYSAPSPSPAPAKAG